MKVCVFAAGLRSAESGLEHDVLHGLLAIQVAWWSIVAPEHKQQIWGIKSEAPHYVVAQASHSTESQHISIAAESLDALRHETDVSNKRFILAFPALFYDLVMLLPEKRARTAQRLTQEQPSGLKSLHSDKSSTQVSATLALDMLIHISSKPYCCSACKAMYCYSCSSQTLLLPTHNNLPLQGKDSYRIDKLADDIAGLVKALGHESCVLVAHDWGGVVAWLAAHSHGSLIDQLVIMCAPHPKVEYDWEQYKR